MANRAFFPVRLFFTAYRHPVRKKTGLSSFFVVLAFGRIFDELETGKTIEPVNK